MKYLFIFITLLPIFLLAQSNQDFLIHEISIGENFYLFSDGGVLPPLSSYYIEDFSEPIVIFHALSYTHYTSENRALQFNFNHYYAGVNSSSVTFLDEKSDVRYFLTLEGLYKKRLHHSSNKKHQIWIGAGLGLRIGFDKFYDNCESFECTIFDINLNSPGIPYLFTYKYQPSSWFSLNSNLGGGFYYPTRTKLTSTRSRRAHFWQGYMGLQAAFRF